MIDSPTKEKLLQILRVFPIFSEQALDQLPQTKPALWRAIKHQTKRLISYAFEEDFQNMTNQVLMEIDKILNTNQAKKLKQKAERNLSMLPQILMKIIRDYELAIDQESDSFEEKSTKNKIILETLEKIMPQWTLTQLTAIVENKLARLEPIRLSRMTQSQINIYKTCRCFKEFCEEQLDIFMSVNRQRNESSPINFLHFNLKESSLGSDKSQTGKIKFAYDSSFKTENRFFETFDHPNSKNQLHVRQKIFETEKQSKIFSKKQGELEHEVEKGEQVEMTEYFSKLNFEIEAEKEKKNETEQQVQKEKTEQKVESDKLIESDKQIQSEKLIQADKQNQNSSVQFVSIVSASEEDERELEEVSQGITTMILQQEQEQEACLIAYSNAMVDIVEAQNRFAQGTYRRETCQIEVQNISNQQLKPLIEFLKRINLRNINLNHSSNLPDIPIQNVRIYGSFDQKCGFKKFSDVNIDISIPSVKRQEIKQLLSQLRNNLQRSKQLGNLNALNLRSIIYNSEKEEIILSHINNSFNSKIRDQTVVNFIYLTVNKKEFTEASDFMKEVIYNGEQKSKEIAQLVSFIHLLFKRNNIIENKDVYDVWWVRDANEGIRKRQSLMQYKHVSLSIYTIQVMVLFYLKQTKQISAIEFNQTTRKYDFELLDKESTLFERFVGFLKYYSRDGLFRTSLVNASYIDVVFRNEIDQNRINSWIQENRVYMTPNFNRNSFKMIHPKIIEMMNQGDEGNERKLISFELRRGSEEEKFFYDKIDGLLEKTENLNPSREWNPENLFEPLYSY